MVDRSLARRILLGTAATPEEAAAAAAAAAAVAEGQEGEGFVKAFGGGAAVYWGGPEGQDEPALCVHARAELKGAEELSAYPGLRLEPAG